MIRQSKQDLQTYIAHKSKSNPKEFYSYVRSKEKVFTSKILPLPRKW